MRKWHGTRVRKKDDAHRASLARPPLRLPPSPPSSSPIPSPRPLPAPLPLPLPSTPLDSPRPPVVLHSSPLPSLFTHLGTARLRRCIPPRSPGYGARARARQTGRPAAAVAGPWYPPSRKSPRCPPSGKSPSCPPPRAKLCKQGKPTAIRAAGLPKSATRPPTLSKDGVFALPRLFRMLWA